MFRSALRLAQSTVSTVTNTSAKAATVKSFTPAAVTSFVRHSSGAVVVSDEEKNAAWIAFFENADTDYIDYRCGMMDVFQEDDMAEPAVLQAALYACRRLNNLPLAMRTLEMIKIKCGHRADVYDYLMQELKPTLDDLGLHTVEEYGLHLVDESTDAAI